MNPFQTFLSTVIQDDGLHAKWLNTLSYLENCGARKIAACEHPTRVKEEMLKHAAEEFRHALHLKRQIKKITAAPFESYERGSIFGGCATLRYLDKLDLHVCRYLKQQGFEQPRIKAAAYLLVTYAIELRAGELYPVYDRLLRQNKSPVTVKSILLEEEEHLRDMEMALHEMPRGMEHAALVTQMEASLFTHWQTISAHKVGVNS